MNENLKFKMHEEGSIGFFFSDARKNRNENLQTF